MVLQEHHEFDNAVRVNHLPEKGFVIAQCSRISEEERFHQKTANISFDFGCLHVQHELLSVEEINGPSTTGTRPQHVIPHIARLPPAAYSESFACALVVWRMDPWAQHFSMAADRH